jgi:hypothetical protein
VALVGNIREVNLHQVEVDFVDNILVVGLGLMEVDLVGVHIGLGIPGSEEMGLSEIQQMELLGSLDVDLVHHEDTVGNPVAEEDRIDGEVLNSLVVEVAVVVDVVVELEMNSKKAEDQMVMVYREELEVGSHLACSEK